MRHTKADLIISCFEGPSGIWGICRSLQWYQVDVGILALHDHLRRLTRSGLLERIDVYHVRRGLRRKQPVWSLTRAGSKRQREIWDERETQRKREQEAADARWWAEWPRIAREPWTLAGWWIVRDRGIACLANPELRERTSSWNVHGFPPGVPEFIDEQARRISRVRA